MRLGPAVLLLASCAPCQPQAPSRLAFDVASVKPQKWTGNGSVGVFIRGYMLDAERADLNSLVEFAYDLKDFQLSGGPAWGTHGMLDDSQLFQVLAKPATGQTPTMDQFRLMLQTLLAERFQLQIHHVSKQLPACNLVANKGGPKLKESAGGEPTFHTSSLGREGSSMAATNLTIQETIDRQLSMYAGRPVFDKTGLTGHYDFTLEWVHDPTAALNVRESDLPPLPTALQEQLGLKLESTTAPFDTVVIDHAEKPSEN